MMASLLGSAAHVRGASPCRGSEGQDMTSTPRARRIFRAIAVVLSLAVPAVITIAAGAGRVGGGSNSGTRGSRNLSPPPRAYAAPRSDNTVHPANTHTR